MASGHDPDRHGNEDATNSSEPSGTFDGIGRIHGGNTDGNGTNFDRHRLDDEIDAEERAIAEVANEDRMLDDFRALAGGDLGESERSESDEEYCTDQEDVYDDEDNSDYALDDMFRYFDNGGSFFTDSEVCECGILGFMNCQDPNTDWKLDSSARNDLHIASIISPGVENRVLSLREELWRDLPEEILFMVLAWLPPAALARFRCVCSKWNSLLSSRMTILEYKPGAWRPSCTVKSNPRALQTSVFCHIENKWFDISCNVVDVLLINPDTTMIEEIQRLADADGVDINDNKWPFPVVFDWKLADVDGELFCYQCNRGRAYWLAVCNPLIPDSAILLPPTPVDSVFDDDFIRLLVDRETRAFKVIVVMHQATVIFNSVQFAWTVFGKMLYAHSDHRCQAFVWKGWVYILRCDDRDDIWGLDEEAGKWIQVVVEPPWDNRQKYAMISNRDQVMVVQLNLKQKEYISIWKLLCNAPNDLPGITSENWDRSITALPEDVMRLLGNVSNKVQCITSASWEKQSIAMPKAIRKLARNFRECMIHGSEYICFHGGKTNQWVKYTFLTQKWCLMPCRGKRLAELQWFDWEPGLDMDLKEYRARSMADDTQEDGLLETKSDSSEV